MARRSKTAMGLDWAFGSASAAATMWHRLSLFGAAGMMSQTERQAEAARMVNEKMAAACEGSWKAGLEATRMMWGVALGGKSATNAPARIADAAMRPAFRKTRANAKRLNRRSLKSSR